MGFLLPQISSRQGPGAQVLLAVHMASNPSLGVLMQKHVSCLSSGVSSFYKLQCVYRNLTNPHHFSRVKEDNLVGTLTGLGVKIIFRCVLLAPLHLRGSCGVRVLPSLSPVNNRECFQNVLVPCFQKKAVCTQGFKEGLLWGWSLLEVMSTEPSSW